jgi:glycogen phosphorylase
MNTDSISAPSVSPRSHDISKLLEHYGGGRRGSMQFLGTRNAFYERHLIFDNVIDLAASTPRDQFEALARSVRDVLSQRWILTDKTYESCNPKRHYYPSMEFLIGPSLANNVTTLLLDPLIKGVIEQKSLQWVDLLEQEPDAGLGNGGLERLAACFMESAATVQLPAMGYGLRYDYGIFKQSIRDGGQEEGPDNNWLRPQDSFELRGRSLHAVSGQPPTLIGIPFDRPIVGYGGSTINTLRLWAASAPDFDNPRWHRTNRSERCMPIGTRGLKRPS